MLKTIIKSIFIFLGLLNLASCSDHPRSAAPTKTLSNSTRDTIIIQKKNELSPSYEVGFLSKSNSYLWVVGKDTLDFQVRAYEYVIDSSLHLSIQHKGPMLFTTALKLVEVCFQRIKDDFYLSKLRLIHFKRPVYYADLATSLSKSYEQRFGRKVINYQQLNEFLLDAELTAQLNTLVGSFDKAVSRYSI